jgi:hypothetical protein
MLHGRSIKKPLMVLPVDQQASVQLDVLEADFLIRHPFVDEGGDIDPQSFVFISIRIWMKVSVEKRSTVTRYSSEDSPTLFFLLKSMLLASGAQ